VGRGRGPDQAEQLRRQMRSFSAGVAGVRWRVGDVEGGRAGRGVSEEVVEVILVELVAQMGGDFTGALGWELCSVAQMWRERFINKKNWNAVWGSRGKAAVAMRYLILQTLIFLRSGSNYNSMVEGHTIFIIKQLKLFYLIVRPRTAQVSSIFTPSPLELTVETG